MNDFEKFKNKMKKEPEKEEKPIVYHRRVEKVEVPDFAAVMKYCRDHIDDEECKQFLEHGSREYAKVRGGGGWSGAIKATLVILNKMRR